MTTWIPAACLLLGLLCEADGECAGAGSSEVECKLSMHGHTVVRGGSNNGPSSISVRVPRDEKGGQRLCHLLGRRQAEGEVCVCVCVEGGVSLTRVYTSILRAKYTPNPCFTCSLYANSSHSFLSTENVSLSHAERHQLFIDYTSSSGLRFYGDPDLEASKCRPTYTF